MSSDTESNENREKILLIQIFSKNKKPTEKPLKKKEVEKPQKKKFKLIKYMCELLRPDPIPTVFLSILKGAKIVEREENTMQSGLPLIDHKEK